MKKLVSLLLALIMVLGCVPMASAAAPKFVAANMSELGTLPEQPTAPEFTMEIVDGNYVLSLPAGEMYANDGYIYAMSWSDEGWGNDVSFYWDADNKVFVSNGLMDLENYPNDAELHFDLYEENTDTYIHLDWETGEVVYTYVVEFGEDGYRDCTWSLANGWFGVYTNEGYSNYDLTDGALNHYTVHADEYNVHYDPYGRINSVSAWVELDDGGTDVEWDFDMEAWTMWDFEAQKYVPIETDLPDFDADEHPALIVLPYEVTLAPSTIDVNSNQAWELFDEDGNLTGYGMAGRNCYCYYDLEGNMTRYQYSDIDNETGVQYSVDGTLLLYWGTAADGTAYNYRDSSFAYILEDGTVVSGWFTWDEEGNLVLCDQPEGLEVPPALINAVKAVEEIWYPYNTMCVAGISLKDTYGITDKWYNVVPVDLTKDGTYTFDLVASGMFLIGKANVTVADGNVTVTYGMPWGHGYIKEEVLNWFTSPSQITAEFCEAPTGAYAFGEPVSISEDLGGAEVGLLFICNRVTYRQPYYNSGAHLVRWYSNKPEWKAFREQLMTIMPE